MDKLYQCMECGEHLTIPNKRFCDEECIERWLVGNKLKIDPRGVAQVEAERSSHVGNRDAA